jgi:hypothetical protein
MVLKGGEPPLPASPSHKRRVSLSQMTHDAKKTATAATRDHARASTLLTDFAYPFPPRGVVIPRAFKASAI